MNPSIHKKLLCSVTIVCLVVTFCLLFSYTTKYVQTENSMPYVSRKLRSITRYDSILNNEENVHLPLSIYTADVNQLPLLFVLPSFPTSGSILARRLYEQASTISAASFYNEVENPMLFLSLPHVELSRFTTTVMNTQSKRSIYVNPQRKLPFGLPTLVKTHFDHPHKIGAQLFEKQGLIQGVVLLVRNPGDTILHNAVRWSHCPRGVPRQQRQECYLQKTGLACSTAVDKVNHWNSFYSKWIDYCEAHNVPLFILHYEDLVLQPNAALQTLFQFTGTVFVNKIEQQQPEKTLGAELSTYCTPTQIERFVGTVEHIALKLGYVWDHSRSKFIWSESMTYPITL